jgi:hypothetical protein
MMKGEYRMSSTEKKAISLLCEQLQAAHRLLEATLGDVTSEEIHWSPPGKANSLGANYAHVVIGEDGTVNGLLRGGAPLFTTTWAGKTGLSELPPAPDPKAPGFPDWSGWAKKVNVDFAALREYSQVVYARSEEYLASLTDDDLDHPVDLSILGLGERTVGYLLINGVLGHALTHCGEISCLKGLQGRRGYPG